MNWPWRKKLFWRAKCSR